MRKQIEKHMGSKNHNVPFKWDDDDFNIVSLLTVSRVFSVMVTVLECLETLVDEPFFYRSAIHNTNPLEQTRDYKTWRWVFELMRTALDHIGALTRGYMFKKYFIHPDAHGEGHRTWEEYDGEEMSMLAFVARDSVLHVMRMGENATYEDINRACVDTMDVMRILWTWA